MLSATAFAGKSDLANCGRHWDDCDQRRDDEAGLSGSPATLVVSRSTKAALATARSES
jgi:hypothetical protein